MASPISVKINVPAWMKKFLISQSENYEEPLIFHNRHNYNRLLINLVSNRRDIKILPEPSEKDKNDETVKIKLPFSKYKDVYFYNNISKDNAINFRKEIKQDFLYLYMVHIRREILKGKTRKIATEEFLKIYNINEDELKYESLYRKYTRYMNKLKLIC